MATPLPSGEAGDEEELLSAINTTPLVDVMLVLLIIFLITIPVVIHTVPVSLPKEANQPAQVRPETVVLSVDRDGVIFWGDQRLDGTPALLAKLRPVAALDPQPEVHIRGDEEARFEFVGRVIEDCQRVGIRQIGFITEPPARGA